MTMINRSLWLALTLSTLGLSIAAAQEADLILHHGKIVTVDKDFTIRQALAVKGDRLIRVGANEEVLKTQGASTVLIDLQGKMVLPGLIDSHSHPTDACMTEFDHPIPDMETIQDVLNYIHRERRRRGRTVDRRAPDLHHTAQGTAISNS